MDRHHQMHDRMALALAEAVAHQLPSRPEWIQLARDHLDRWERRNADSPSLVRCYREWREILKLPLQEVVAILTAQTDEGQRLRQNSPFVGMLPRSVVADIKRRCRNEPSTI